LLLLFRLPHRTGRPGDIREGEHRRGKVNIRGQKVEGRAGGNTRTLDQEVDPRVKVVNLQIEINFQFEIQKRSISQLLAQLHATWRTGR
jgi:hypothetical protein